MARGKKCPNCSLTMYARDERYEPKGTYVTYVCRNDSCPNYVKSNRRYRFEERVFEPSR
jgi:hypothetical protein